MNTRCVAGDGMHGAERGLSHRPTSHGSGHLRPPVVQEQMTLLLTCGQQVNRA